MEWKKITTTSERLKEAMHMSNMKQVDLARATGLSKGGISNYVIGRYEPKSDIISKLAYALDCSEMWLWGYDVPKERQKEQKKSDRISNIIQRLRSDTEFANIIFDLDSLDETKLASIKQLLTVLK